MDSDEGKLFVGGVSWETTEDTLRDYFASYGDVSQVVIMRDKTTGRPRGFGFVVFSDPAVLDRVLHESHTIDGRTVEAKRALSREEQQTSSRTGNSNPGRGSGGDGGGGFKTKKIFVGGLPPTLTEDGFRGYFETYGPVADVVVMYDQHTQRPRGFGFVTFDNEDAVDRVLHKTFHELNGKSVEVKRALPKDSNPGGNGRSGGYQGYGGSGASAGDSRMDGNRYMQSQTSAAGGYGAYSGYAAPSYGYGAPNSAVGYGAYGAYGVGAGFGGATGAYGMPGAIRGQWGGQAPAGYGAFGYNTAAGGYGAGAGAAQPWNASGGSNYGGSDGSYSSGYGSTGGRPGNAPNSTGGMEHQGGGGGYGDSNGNAGYEQQESWGSDPSGGGGYNGGHTRQAS
ncbi:Heterogeneous nuclear ribonucleoprotein 1 [Linum perenne]